MPVSPFNYDPSSDSGKVRLLAFDADSTYAVFNDYEIQAFLDLNAGEVKFAAAQALERQAASQAIILKKGKLLDIETDGATLAQSLLGLAKELRRQVQEDPTAWEWAEEVDFLTYSQRLWDERLREGV